MSRGYVPQTASEGTRDECDSSLCCDEAVPMLTVSLLYKITWNLLTTFVVTDGELKLKWFNDVAS